MPEPGLWFQFRILESKDDTRILQRPSARLGDSELSGQRLASDGQRYAEHKFKMTLGPLTTRFVLVSVDVKESRGIGVKILADGKPTDSGWIVAVPAGRGNMKTEARRVTEDGTAPGGARQGLRGGLGGGVQSRTEDRPPYRAERVLPQGRKVALPGQELGGQRPHSLAVVWGAGAAAGAGASRRANGLLVTPSF